MSSFKSSCREIVKLEEKIKHYEILNLPLNFSEKIDEGSYANIYKFIISYKNEKKKAAIKVLKKQFSKKKILEVANKLSKLNHENIVQFQGYSLRPSAVCFEICEVSVEGELVNNVSQLIQIFNEGNHFVFKERLDLVLQATKGLQYLHVNGITHRDFKPSNLLVSGTLSKITIKVGDFDDIVDLKNTIRNTLTKTGNFVKLAGMTLGYAAPELVLKSETASIKSDIYSWAVTSYEIFCNLTSAWENVIPLMNDSIVLKALEDKKRPSLLDLMMSYGNSSEIKVITDLIGDTWKDDSTKRLNLNMVYIYIYSITLLL